jgi:hypothetical protein
MTNLQSSTYAGGIYRRQTTPVRPKGRPAETPTQDQESTSKCSPDCNLDDPRLAKAWQYAYTVQMDFVLQGMMNGSGGF